MNLRLFSLSLSISLLMLPLAACATDKPTTDSYAVAFDRSTPRTRTDRVLSIIMLGGQTINVDHSELMYNDLTDRYFNVNPGQTVQPMFGFSNTWMQGYVYIDLNRNGRFDVKQPGANGRLQAGNELMTFAGMTVSNGKFDSAGNALSNLAAVQPPSFVVPDTLAEGFYMMRWKVDWDWADPAGRMDGVDDITKNGGAIVDVLLRVTHDKIEDDYELVFSDEFDQTDFSSPDPTKWHASDRRNATWNRWISDSPDVAFVQDGSLVCRAIPNPDTSKDKAEMLTGAVETSGLFSFTYGKVLVRLRTTNHTGNFPAAWMMPQPPCDGWPKGGEIDIFESIDSKNKSYHTVHSDWTYTLGHKNSPTSSFNLPMAVDGWHTYGMEWTENAIIWTVDDKLVGSYTKSIVKDELDQGQWPFDHPFYLILNQSVGNGSWAQNADTSFTYETRFDWIRVYQKKKPGNEAAVPDIAQKPATDPYYYDLGGRRIHNGGNASGGVHLRPGIYIHNGKKIIVRRTE